MQMKHVSIGLAAMALASLSAMSQGQVAGGGMPGGRPGEGRPGGGMAGGGMGPGMGGGMGGGVAGGPRGAPASASKDPAASPAGAYVIDQRHAGVVARIAHGGGISWSTFRFTGVAGKLDWNPADPAQSKLAVTVDMKSITSAADGFAADLVGDRFLKTAQFPTATFVSGRITRTGPTTGRIDGNLTFMGVTKPATIEASLVGVGRDMRGKSAIGFSGTMSFKRSDFGFASMMGMIGDDVQMTLDVELANAA